MFLNWPEHTAHVKKSFGELGKNHPKMLQAYGALEQAAAAEALDAKTRELICPRRRHHYPLRKLHQRTRRRSRQSGRD